MSDRIDCYYGPPGAAKSSAIAAVIAQLFQETGKKSRVLIGDGSAATYVDSGLVDAGACELMDYTIRDWPISTLEQLCEGAWPADPLDPKSKMMPATPHTMANLALTGIEGISMVGLYIMGDKKGGLAQRAGAGEKIGQDSPIQIIDGTVDAAGRWDKKEGTGRAYGGNPPSHYNVAQKRLAGIIERSKMLPGWVIWSAHERAAANKLTGETVIGPEGAGEAATAQLPRIFNNTLHFTTAEKAVKEADAHTGAQISMLDTVYRVYTRNHFRPEGKMFVKYLATTRIKYPDMMPLFLESDIPGHSILEFYRIIEQSRTRAATELAAARALKAAS